MVTNPLKYGSTAPSSASSAPCNVNPRWLGSWCAPLMASTSGVVLHPNAIVPTTLTFIYAGPAFATVNGSLGDHVLLRGGAVTGCAGAAAVCAASASLTRRWTSCSMNGFKSSITLRRISSSVSALTTAGANKAVASTTRKKRYMTVLLNKLSSRLTASEPVRPPSNYRPDGAGGAWLAVAGVENVKWGCCDSTGRCVSQEVRSGRPGMATNGGAGCAACQTQTKQESEHPAAWAA